MSLYLSFLNGTVIHVDTPEIQTSYNSIGILDGSANTFIGRSNCGKSTFLTQVGIQIQLYSPVSNHELV